MILRHLHCPGLTSYAVASKLQEGLVKTFLAHKASPATVAAPSPTIITAQFQPVYTCGRREIGTVSVQQQDHLRGDGEAEFFEAMRGGQTTFHGPGQLIAYPIIDLKQHALTPKAYVCLLEKSLIKTCTHYGIATMTTEHPGVWTTPNSKIAALGIHLRRNVTSHGIGLNVSTDLRWFDRIVACGLEGKKTTSFENEGTGGRTVTEIGDVFVTNFAAALTGISGVEKTQPPLIG